MGLLTTKDPGAGFRKADRGHRRLPRPRTREDECKVTVGDDCLL